MVGKAPMARLPSRPTARPTVQAASPSPAPRTVLQRGLTAVAAVPAHLPAQVLDFFLQLSDLLLRQRTLLYQHRHLLAQGGRFAGQG